jgi:hydroxyacylglutathione hydrolase
MSKVIVKCYVIGQVMTNCYYVYREGSHDAVFVDPADYGDKIYEALQAQGLNVAAILLTHAHFDHIWGLQALKEKCGAKVYANALEEDVCQSAELNHSAMHGRPCTVQPDVLLRDGESVTLAGITFRMISTPGHTHGSCCYYIEGHDTDGSRGGTEDAPILLSGDTLFFESCGRTDLPTGSSSDMVHSVKDKLFLLPDDTIVYPGHEEFTTIGHEKENNFLI